MPDQDEGGRGPSRATLVRDLVLLQLKLLVDGFRDVLLVPASLVAGVMSLLSSGPKPGPQFYRLLAVGRRSERWIDLFGALRNAPPDDLPGAEAGEAGIDDLAERVEAYVVEEYRRGGVTKQALERIGKAIDALQKRGR